jgi:hypothetical protein
VSHWPLSNTECNPCTVQARSSVPSRPDGAVLTLRGLPNPCVAAGSSPSRVAGMGAADPSVSLDLLIRTVLSLGAGRDTVAEMIENHCGEEAPS